MSFDQRTVTEKRRAANQAAAQKSTGPKSPGGKQRASLNSLKHGAFATEEHVRAAELDRFSAGPEFDRLRQLLLDDWKPAGPQQSFAVDDLAWLYWLRDRARTALLAYQTGQARYAELRRDQRAHNARHRPLAFSRNDIDEDGLVTMPPSRERLRCLEDFLADLEDFARAGQWGPNQSGPRGGYGPSGVFRQLFGGHLASQSATRRGRRLRELWNECERDKASPDDPRAGEILALLGEERALLPAEREIAERAEQLDLERPLSSDWPDLAPLDETWQRLATSIERLDRQINAKMRLLLRLEKRAREAEGGARPSPRSGHAPQAGDTASRPEVCATHATDAHQETTDTNATDKTEPACPAAPAAGIDTEIAGTKPNESLESTRLAVSKVSGVGHARRFSGRKGQQLEATPDVYTS